MKYFILLLCSLATSIAQAQFPGFRSSAIRQFSKSVEKASASDAAFREKLSVLLPDAETKLDRAGKDSAAFDAVVDATFLIQNDPKRYMDWLTDIGVAKTMVPQLADYALLRFTNRIKPDPRRPAGFPFGLRLFKPQDGGQGYFLVRLERDGKIELQSFDYRGYNNFTVTGVLKGNRVIADDGHYSNRYFFMEGVLGIAPEDTFSTAYHACDLYGKFLQEPKPVFEDIAVTDILAAAGLPETEITAIMKAKEKQNAMVVMGPNDSAPNFPGGDESLINYLQQHLKYPAEVAKKRASGTVNVLFVITPEGQVKDVHVVRKIGNGMDEEAIRVVSAMPKWIPAKKNGTPVTVGFMLPITFSGMP